MILIAELYVIFLVPWQVRQVTNQVPVNARPDAVQEEPTDKPVTERLASWKKTADTPSKAKPADPTELPLSERFAGKVYSLCYPECDVVTESILFSSPL